MKVGELKKVLGNQPNNAEVLIKTSRPMNKEPAQAVKTEAIRTENDEKHSYVVIIG